MIDESDVIEIGGREGTICFKTVYNDTKYICVAFEGDKIEYKVYKYKDDDGRLLVSEVKNEEELVSVIKIFYNEGLEEFGIPAELDEVLDNLDN